MILGELCNLSEPEFPRLENMVVMKIHKENACMPSTEQVLDKVIGDYIYVHIYERERESSARTSVHVYCTPQGISSSTQSLTHSLYLINIC